VIVISVIGIDTNSDAAANKGKIVNVPESTQTAVSDGSKWLYCGVDSSFSETPPGGSTSGGECVPGTGDCPTNCGIDYGLCSQTNILTGNIEFGGTLTDCMDECGKSGYLSYQVWADNDGGTPNTCQCGDGTIIKGNPCTIRAGTCRLKEHNIDCKYIYGYSATGKRHIWMEHLNFAGDKT